MKEHGAASELILKLHEGRPSITDAIANGDLHLVINTPVGKRGIRDDSYIRKAAVKNEVPYITTMAAARAAVSAIEASRQDDASRAVKNLQAYRAGIGE